MQGLARGFSLLRSAYPPSTSPNHLQHVISTSAVQCAAVGVQDASGAIGIAHSLHNSEHSTHPHLDFKHNVAGGSVQAAFRHPSSGGRLTSKLND
jgi:hypothetical protein